MAKIFERVNPGDLITAESMNLLQETVETLDDRLSALETATKGSISGTVKDAGTNLPITGAVVRAIVGNVSYTSPPTDSQGMYTITDLLPGDYLVCATAENYIESAAQTVSVAQGISRVANFVLTPRVGLVIVPKLFGLSLGQAKATLTSPEVGLVPGNIITTHGERIYPDNVAALEMVVLNQVPDAGEAVQPGSSVDIVIASLPSEGPGPAPEHRVTGIDPEEGARVGQPITVIGESFVSPLYRNRVSFDNEVVLPRPASTSTRLNVIVPDTLSGLPRSVRVCVEIDGVSKCLEQLYPIDVASGEPELIINATDPSDLVTIGFPFSLIGTGFDPAPENNRITFILASDATKRHMVNPDTVSSEGEIMRMTINKLGEHPNEFPSDMAPSQFGTSYQIELTVGEKQAFWQIVIAAA
ncbi:MAG: carboxypeptidase regulatory-like domain-containing protein [Candidatus Hodarchaeota archaeon]